MTVGPVRLLLHVLGESDALATAVRIGMKARAELGGEAKIELVVHGPAVVALTTAADGPEGVLSGLEESSVLVVACRNSLASFGLSAADLIKGVGSVPAAIAHLAIRQGDGWSYVRL
ncbi:MAG: DsrE family protein [Microcella sp.]|uniref:DsrE family protein n=1 Tax=Microcella sp. TaxID=1913979 RepID=UPI002718AEC4|nr:DsrE family protein [Microcella sp.]MDO8337070.1 DsrE family protein [Microcella sp.]